MKLLLLILIAGMYFTSYSQDNTRFNLKIFKVRVTHTTAYISTGFIAGIDDSTLKLTPSVASIRYNSLDEKDMEKIHYTNIEKVVIKRKGSVGRGLLYGALIGLGTGAIAGLAMGSDPEVTYGNPNLYGIDVAFNNAFRLTAGEKAVILGGTGAFGGAVIGGILGAIATKKFIIGGRKDKFDKMQLSVLDRVYGKRIRSNE